MSILIKGIQMPKTYPLTVTIYPDGQVLSETVGAKDKHGMVVPVPPHGRLIDADTLYEDCALDCKYEIAATTTRVNEYIQLKIDAAPTVIPAEQKGE